MAAVPSGITLHPIEIELVLAEAYAYNQFERKLNEMGPRLIMIFVANLLNVNVKYGSQ